MIWLSIAGAVFLVWFILVVLFTPGINYRCVMADIGARPGFLCDSVHVPGGAPLR